MKQFILLPLCIVCINQIYAQDSSLRNSVKDLFSKYTSLSATTQGLQLEVEEMGKTIDVLNEELDKKTTATEFSAESIVKKREKDIMRSYDFIIIANPLFDQILRTSETESILQNLTALNNINDSSLGFSISTDLKNILDLTLFKNPKAKEGTDKGKFFQLVDKILKSPLTRGISEMMPLGNAIRSVADLSFSAALGNPRISVADLSDALNSKFKYYIIYYDGLENAYTQYELGLNSLKVRRDAIRDLLRSYAFHFNETLLGEEAADKSEEAYNDLFKYFFIRSKIEQTILSIKKDTNNCSGEGMIDYDKLINEHRLMLSDIDVMQAKFINDELIALSNSYYDNLIKYNENVLKVIEDLSGNIGNPTDRSVKTTQIKANISQLNTLKENSTTLINLNANFEEMLKP